MKDAAALHMKAAADQGPRKPRRVRVKRAYKMPLRFFTVFYNPNLRVGKIVLGCR